jgi:hypothetical protein
MRRYYALHLHDTAYKILYVAKFHLEGMRIDEKRDEKR